MDQVRTLVKKLVKKTLSMFFIYFLFLQILGDSVEDPERQLGDGGGGLGPVRDED